MSHSTSSFATGHDLARQFLAQLRDPAFLPAIYSDLFTIGIDEGSLHAYMLSGLVLVGDRLGFSPVCDSPIFDRLDKLLTCEGAKRPDAVWFSRGTRVVRCLVEFERYTSQSLLPKAQNLLIMGKELRNDLDLAVLNYWTYATVPDSELQGPRRIFEAGFYHSSGLAFAPLRCPALVIETLVSGGNGQAFISATIPRLFIADGENKSYVVDELAS